MGTLATFVLGVVAFLGVLKLVFDPKFTYLRAMEGKTASEMVTQLMEEGTWELALIKGCAQLGYLSLLAIILTVFAEPIFAIAALVNRIGHPILAFACLAITAVAWVSWVNTLRTSAKTSLESYRVETALNENEAVVAAKEAGGKDAAEKVKAELRKVKEKPLEVNWTKQWVGRIIFAYPEVYLLYLFVVSLLAIFNKG